MSFKRTRDRTPSLASSSASSSSSQQTCSQKVPRTTETIHPLLCTLPPMCNPPQNRPTPLANTAELEAHYAKYHAHVCQCECVFPEERMLELHQTECHDPIAAVRKERGEKIFACLLSTCLKIFANPKARRLHLIQAHGYPKEYFFAVTNKGVGGLLRRWGEGASMLRGEWHAREAREEMMKDEDDDENHEMDAENGANETANKMEEEALCDSLSTLSLVPPSIRFGRGGRSGGLGHARGNMRGGRGRGGSGRGNTGTRGMIRGRTRGRRTT